MPKQLKKALPRDVNQRALDRSLGDFRRRLGGTSTFKFRL
jgi:hypothetical protein